MTDHKEELEISSCTKETSFTQMYYFSADISDESRAGLWTHLEEINGVLDAFARLTRTEHEVEVEVEMQTVEGVEDIPRMIRKIDKAIRAFLETEDF